MNIRLQRGATDWRFLLVGLAIGLWLGLAVFLLRDDSPPAPACPVTSCCGGCGGTYPHHPPVSKAFIPPGPARYYCGRSDQGGGFVWDQGGGYVWDQGGGYVWDQGTDQGGGWVWDQGGGWVWDQGGGWVWDQGGGYVWDAGASPTPLQGSAIVPVPTPDELGRNREQFEFQCDTGNQGPNDVQVVNQADDAVVIVMPNGNERYECVVSDTGGPKVVGPVDPRSGDRSPDRAYCMVVEGSATEFLDPDWAN